MNMSAVVNDTHERSEASVDDPHPAFNYGGREWRAPKDWVYGTHRAMAPEATLERIRPHLATAGITRVADITELDTVGVPVATAMRPASLTLAVEAGKGATTIAAATSAAMEALERFVAECELGTITVGRVDEVIDDLLVPLASFPLNRAASVSPVLRYAWGEMENLRTGERGLVPADCIRLADPSCTNPLLLTSPWQGSSNGLASGNHLPEALCAALYEVIERDATSCWKHAVSQGADRLLVDLDTVTKPVIRGVLDQVLDAGSMIRLYWCPTEVGIPTFHAEIWEQGGGTGYYGGYGCHLDPEIAMIRAVTEAVQARTVFVAGARDDLGRRAFSAMRRGPRSYEVSATVISVDEVKDRSTSSFHGDIAVMMQALDDAGFGTVLAHEFDAERFEVSVVRVIVPGLEPYHFAWTEPTERARSFTPPPIG